MRRDRKAAQKKKDRAAAQQAVRRKNALNTPAAMIRRARECPHGPAFMSRGWRDEDLPPRLVSVVLTRKVSQDVYVPQILLIDRTCLGIKDAIVGEPISRAELGDLVARVFDSHPEGGEEVEPAVAQSVVFAALEYAAELGFAPQPDFDEALAGPRPTPLADTPLARLERPFYAAGPYDDVDAILDSLEEAVGEDGFDVDFNDDDPSDDDEVIESGPRAPDEHRLTEAIRSWLSASDSRLELEAGVSAYAHAVLGEPLVVGRTEIPKEHLTSLPPFWIGFFRPLTDGRTGLDLAAAAPSMKAHAVELDRLRRSRAVLFDLLAIDRSSNLAKCRDVFSGALLDLRMDPSLTPGMTRWTRFFGYITPMADGTWYPPSALFGHPWLRNLEPLLFVERLNALLADLSISERVDPTAPASGLLRFGALAHGVLARSLAPNEEQAALASKPIYMVNSDGERFELHEATFTVDRDTAAALVRALSAADDFVQDEGFLWSPKGSGKGAIVGEHLGVVSPGKAGFRVVANSVERYRRLLERLSNLVEMALTPSALSVFRPWEHEDRAVAEEHPNAERMTVGMTRVDGHGAANSVDALTLASIRRALDEEIPALGGRPRDLVRDPAGRASVEQWLEEQELRGLPPTAGEAFLDLDDLRRELGLPLVVPA